MPLIIRVNRLLGTYLGVHAWHQKIPPSPLYKKGKEIHPQKLQDPAPDHASFPSVSVCGINDMIARERLAHICQDGVPSPCESKAAS